MGISIEELKEYCEQLCNEGKGRQKVVVGLKGYEDTKCRNFNNLLDGLSFNDDKLCLEVECEDGEWRDGRYVRALIEEVKKDFDDLKCSSVGNMEDAMSALDSSIENLEVETNDW